MAPPTRQVQVGMPQVVVEVPIIPRIAWDRDACFHCLCHNLDYFLKNVDKLCGRPPIRCFTRDATNPRCDTCEKCNVECRTISAGMEGNTHDLFSILRWCDRVYDHENSLNYYHEPVYYPFWTEAEKYAIRCATVKFLASFKKAEYEHRLSAQLDVLPAHRQERYRGYYAENLVLMKRYLSIIHPGPAPMNPMALYLWQVRRLPRITRHAEGYDTIKRGKEEFGNTMTALLNSKDHTTATMLKALLRPGLLVLG